MSFLNIEIKARCQDSASIHRYLQQHGAEFRGIDLQTDTYFRVNQGRLKLREGNIENNLIYYERGDQAGPRESHFHLVQVPDPASLKEVLTRSCGILVTVRKKRSIYFIQNVKFHIDEVKDLGAFLEIEASNKDADLPAGELRAQCDFYMKEFGVNTEDCIAVSYSDLLLKKKPSDSSKQAN